MIGVRARVFGFRALGFMVRVGANADAGANVVLRWYFLLLVVYRLA